MSDAIGRLTFPLAPPAVYPAAERDVAQVVAPHLHALGSFAATVLQAELGDAWRALAVGRGAVPKAVDGLRAGDSIVRRVWHSDPRLGGFEPGDLPGLFVFDTNKTDHPRVAADWYRGVSNVVLSWVPHRVDLDRRLHEREPFFGAVDKVLSQAFARQRHPAWVVAADAAAPAGLLSAPLASALTPTTITSFNGSLIPFPLDYGRPVTVATSAAVGAYDVSEPVVVRGLLDDGNSFTDSLYLMDPDGGETVVGVWSFRTVTQLDVPAQLLATGAFTFGFYASPYARFGSLIQNVAGFTELQRATSQVLDLRVEKPNARPDVYRALEFSLTATDEHAFDPLRTAQAYDPDAAPGLDAGVHQGEQHPFNSLLL
jgi:hypothetical protein